MRKGENFNHPNKGASIKVDPIKDKEALVRIKLLLKDKPRDFALFILGINTNLRASDLLRITAGKVRDLNAGDDLEIVEKKTRKARRITLNGPCMEALRKLLDSREYKDDEPLFLGQRGRMTVPYVNYLVKSWCKSVGLVQGNYGAHTLRKTFGFHQRKTFSVSLPILVDIFNHSSQKQTMQYLCIQPEEVREVYLNEL
jgi:integrase